MKVNSEASETSQWIIDKIHHYHKQGWTKSEIDAKFPDVPFEIRIEHAPNYGDNALGSKTESYFESESEYEYVPPIYSELSKEEKKIYRHGSN